MEIMEFIKSIIGIWLLAQVIIVPHIIINDENTLLNKDTFFQKC